MLGFLSGYSKPKYSAMLRSMVVQFLKFFKPLVYKLADIFDIKIERHCYALGQNSLTFEDSAMELVSRIPKSVQFNTRSGKIKVAKNVVFGEDVKVLTGCHLSKFDSRNPLQEHHFVPSEGRDIEIGEGCYLGTGSMLIGPLKMGPYTILGAGAVATHDLEPCSFYAGVPAKKIKSLKD